ncbi:MAG TPA: hypothetical protein VEC02_02725 [Nitrososphaerales archaeon]|nr:hypothetical protein [Nitrososphaerales archaeon]
MAFDIFWMNIAALFAFLNVALVGTLIVLYFQSWRRLRSSLSASLMTFAVFFLVQNFVIIIFWLVLYGLAPQSLVLESVVVAAAPYLVAINALESLALGNLVRITWA